jgi:hypothetical protein
MQSICATAPLEIRDLRQRNSQISSASEKRLSQPLVQRELSATMHEICWS